MFQTRLPPDEKKTLDGNYQLYLVYYSSKSRKVFLNKNEGTLLGFKATAAFCNNTYNYNKNAERFFGIEDLDQ